MVLEEPDDQKWHKHLVTHNGKWVVHRACDRGMHGAMNASLLECKNLEKDVKSWDLVMRPYHPCVWDKMIGANK